MPGFVDTHHHLTQSFGKALVFGEPSEIFRRVWVPLEGEPGRGERLPRRQAGRAGVAARRLHHRLRSGHPHGADVGVVAEATGDAGIRCVLGMICNDLRPDGGASRTNRDRAGTRPTSTAGSGTTWSTRRWRCRSPRRRRRHSGRRRRELCRSRGAVFQTHVNEHLAAVERRWSGTAGALGAAVRRRRARPAMPAGPRHAPDADRDRHAARHRRRGRATTRWPAPGRATPSRRADLRRARHPLRHRHRRHPRRRVPPDGCRRDAQRLAFGALPATPRRAAAGPGSTTPPPRAPTPRGCRGVTGAIAAGPGRRLPARRPRRAGDAALSWDLAGSWCGSATASQIAAVFVAGRLRLLAGWPVGWDARALMRRVAERARAADGDARRSASCTRRRPRTAASARTTRARSVMRRQAEA